MSRVWHESQHNIRGRPGLAILLILALGAGILGASWAEVSQLRDAQLRAAALLAAGYQTLQIIPSSDVQLTGTECAALQRIPGVLAATWLGTPEGALLSTGQTTQVLQVGPTFPLLVASVDRYAAALWNGQQAFVDRSDTLAAGRHRVGVVGVDRTGLNRNTLRYQAADLEGLGPIASTSIDVVTNYPDKVASCLAVVDESSRSSVFLSATARWPAIAGYSVAWVMAGSESILPASVGFDTRNTRAVWLVGAVLVLLTWSLILRIRRNDLAFYAMAGVRRREILAILYLEYLTVACASFLVSLGGIAIKLVIVRSADVSAAIALSTGARVASAVTGLGLLVTIVAIPHSDSRLVNALKDR